jgi:hypothetical protein
MDPQKKMHGNLSSSLGEPFYEGQKRIGDMQCKSKVKQSILLECK